VFGFCKEQLVTRPTIAAASNTTCPPDSYLLGGRLRTPLALSIPAGESFEQSARRAQAHGLVEARSAEQDPERWDGMS